MKESSPRSGWTRGSIVFTAVAVVSLGSAIVSVGLGSSSYGRLERARAQLAAEQKRAASDKPVGLDARGTHSGSVIGQYRLGTADLAVGDARALVKVLERADLVDRQHTFVASLIAAKLIDGVADRINAEPWLLDDGLLRAAIRRTSFASARRPFEAERLHAKSRLAEVPSEVPFRTAGLVQSTTAQAMDDVDATLHAMEDSVLAGDQQRCEEVSQRPRGLARQVVIGASTCLSAKKIVDSGKRLQRLQTRAATRSRPPTVRTARSSVPL